MIQTIDPIKLKAAAEHLEWVLQQYPDSDEVQGVLHALQPLIQAAMTESVSSQERQLRGRVGEIQRNRLG